MVLAGVTAFAATPEVSGRAIRIVVPVPPGGTSDLVARLIADILSDALAQPVIVENKAGATGRIAAEALKRAKPDGATLLLAPIAVPVLTPLLYAHPGFDPTTDFAPISQAAQYSFALAVRADHPARNVGDFVTWLKAHPAQANFGTAGAGSAPHFLGTMIGRATGLKLEHVPYRGASDVEKGILSGDIAAGISAVPDFLEMHRAGKLRILATSGPIRSMHLPAVATLREQGLSDIEIVGWTALFAPAGTPPHIIDTLSAAIAKSLQVPSARERFVAIGVEPTGTGAKELAAIVARDTAQWARIIKASGFTTD